ncbi:MAG: hypothetical protein KF862_15275 [Chitinophagaceae bacterium]|nr:hypothetical protein [Chitinophagaceae bacterium]
MIKYSEGKVVNVKVWANSKRQAWIYSVDEMVVIQPGIILKHRSLSLPVRSGGLWKERRRDRPDVEELKV